MTTSRSPLSELMQQSDAIARMLKKAEASLASLETRKPTIKVGVVMDDKLITIELAWDDIAKASEAGLAAWVLGYMQGARVH